METTTFKKRLPATFENITKAFEAIRQFADRRRLVCGPWRVQDVPAAFPSKHQQKMFERRMNHVIEHPTMRSCNSFLRYFGETRVEYSAKEQAIRAKKKALNEACAQVKKARTDYLIEKGDFYGGRIRVHPPSNGVAK